MKNKTASERTAIALKAVATRKYNASHGIKPNTRGSKLFTSVNTFKVDKFEKGVFQKLVIDYPCEVYIHRSTNALYISPSNVIIEMPKGKVVIPPTESRPKYSAIYSLRIGESTVVPGRNATIRGGVYYIGKTYNKTYKTNQISSEETLVIRVK